RIGYPAGRGPATSIADRPAPPDLRDSDRPDFLHGLADLRSAPVEPARGRLGSRHAPDPPVQVPQVAVGPSASLRRPRIARLRKTPRSPPSDPPNGGLLRLGPRHSAPILDGPPDVPQALSASAPHGALRGAGAPDSRHSPQFCLPASPALVRRGSGP